MKILIIACCVLLTSFTWTSQAKLFGFIRNHKSVLQRLSHQLNDEVQTLSRSKLSHDRLMRIHFLLDALFSIIGLVLKLPLFAFTIVGSPFLFSLAVIGRLLEILIHFFVPGIIMPGQTSGFVEPSEVASNEQELNGLANYDYYPSNDNYEYNENIYHIEYYDDDNDYKNEYSNTDPSDEKKTNNNDNYYENEYSNIESLENMIEHSNHDSSDEKVDNSDENTSNVEHSNENKKTESSDADKSNEDADDNEITEMIKQIIGEMEEITTMLARHKDEDDQDNKLGRYFVPINNMLRSVVSAVDNDTQSHENKKEDLQEIQDSAESLLRIVESQMNTKTKSYDETVF